MVFSWFSVGSWDSYQVIDLSKLRNPSRHPFALLTIIRCSLNPSGGIVGRADPETKLGVRDIYGERAAVKPGPQLRCGRNQAC